MKEERDPLRSLYEEYANCSRCELHKHRKKTVFGSGNREADILIVTDSPTLVEDRLGHHNTSDVRWVLRAFRHALGKESMPLGAAAEVFFDKCFLTSATMCTRKMLVGDDAGDRVEPAWTHIRECNARLQETIYHVDPLVIVGAGKFAMMGLLGRSSNLPPRTGKVSAMTTIAVPGALSDSVHYSVIPTFDPHVAERRGDYDDPSGAVSAFTTALVGALQLTEYLREEDR